MYLLNSIFRWINSSTGTSHRALLEALVGRLREALSAKGVAILDIDPEGVFMDITASAGLSDRFLRYFTKTDRLRVGEGLSGRAMRERRSFTVADMAEYAKLAPPRWAQMMKEEGLVSMAAVPIFLREEAVGSLVLWYGENHQFSDSEVMAIEVLASQIAALSANEKQYAQIAANAATLREQVESMVNTQRLTGLLNVHLHESLDIPLESIGDYFGKKFAVKSIGIFRSDPRTDTLVLSASYRISPDGTAFYATRPVRVNDLTLMSLALRTKEAQVTERALTDDRIGKEWGVALANEGTPAMGAFPLLVEDRAIGVFAVFYEHIHEFRNDELAILSTFAQFLAVVVENRATFTRLMTERQKTKSMVDSLGDGLIVYDLERRILDLNPKAMTLLGLPKDAIFIGMKPADLRALGETHAVLARLSELNLPEGETKEFETDPSLTRVLHVSEVKLYDEEGRATGFMRTLHDITQEKMVELLKTNFVATASHQLRTPLTGIKWGLLSLEEGAKGDLNENQREFIARLARSADNMTVLVNDMLQLAKLEEGVIAAPTQKQSIVELIQRILSDFHLNIENMGLRVDLAASPDTPAAPFDAETMSLALRNLIDNAIKYSRKEGRITIRLSPRTEEGMLEIAIEDNGIGISEKDRPMLFNKFYRAENAVRFRTEGSGLGLFFVRRIIERHNGTITFTSAEGSGSTFVVRIPLEAGANM